MIRILKFFGLKIYHDERSNKTYQCFWSKLIFSFTNDFEKFRKIKVLKWDRVKLKRKVSSFRVFLKHNVDDCMMSSIVVLYVWFPIADEWKRNPWRSFSFIYICRFISDLFLHHFIEKYWKISSSYRYNSTGQNHGCNSFYQSDEELWKSKFMVLYFDGNWIFNWNFVLLNHVPSDVGACKMVEMATCSF